MMESFFWGMVVGGGAIGALWIFKAKVIGFTDAQLLKAKDLLRQKGL